MTAHRNRFVTLFCLLPLLLWATPTAAAEQTVASWHVQRDTAQLGGVEHPSVDQLLEMHEGPYVLRARDGRLTKVTAAKSRLPFDPEFHPQGGIIYRAHDRLIYVKQATIFSKSTDGGRTWTSRAIEPPPAGMSEKWQVLNDGSFIRVSLS
ncbi:MAG: hypothetical protein CMJ81_23510, partial [Planctomycetaceae bacterium]|nr:hypothetical protein [Planctomycetaceae bacterium]